jgi:hypothetical protein
MSDLYDPIEQQPRLPDPEDMDTSVPGDAVLLYAEGARPEVVIRTPREREDWIAIPPPESWANPKGAPTTIDYRGKFYEIIDIERHGSFYEYWLMPWPEGTPLNHVINYGPESERLRHEKAEFERKRRRQGWFVGWLSPVIGLLPGFIQVRAAYRFNLQLDVLTTSSCALEGLFAVYLLFVGVVLNFVASHVEGTPVSYLPSHILWISSSVWTSLAPFLLLESWIRWRMFQRSGRVHGTLPLELLGRLV